LNAIKQLVKKTLTLTASAFGEHNTASKEPKLWVLMYHRILPAHDPRFQLEEPGMIVTPETFDMHLSEAKRLFEVISLSEWLTKAKNGDPLPEKACAITFDDGWLDNYEFALPLLKKHAIPATLFTVVDKIGSDFKFWPNIVSELIKKKSEALTNHPLLTAAARLSKRHYSVESVAHCISLLKQYSEDEIFAALDHIDWRKELRDSTPSLMNWTQVSEMNNDGNVDIGSHTCTHRRLNKGLDRSILEYEIQQSKGKLKDTLPKAVDLFCFPNGDYDRDALKLVKSTYSAAVTTRKGINRASTLKAHELFRIAMHNDGSDTRHKFRAKLSGWR